ncbi:MAG: hypothetical protein OZ917_02005 [Candidatus Brocadiaceae bacterium]|nr:hypothetical protein [Candidatus Brocadiaceae bacterium]
MESILFFIALLYVLRTSRVPARKERDYGIHPIPYKPLYEPARRDDREGSWLALIIIVIFLIVLHFTV